MMAGDIAATNRWRFSVWHGGFVLRSALRIEAMAQAGVGAAEAARLMGRHPTTVQRELRAQQRPGRLRRGGGAGWVLCPGGQAQGPQAGRRW